MTWPITTLAADPTLSSLLEDPEAALAWLEEQDAAAPTLAGFYAQERAFNRCALVAEMCAAVGGRSMLDIQLRFARRHSQGASRLSRQTRFWPRSQVVTRSLPNSKRDVLSRLAQLCPA